jgi:hypothetical protein
MFKTNSNVIHQNTLIKKLVLAFQEYHVDKYAQQVWNSIQDFPVSVSSKQISQKFMIMDSDQGVEMGH